VLKYIGKGTPGWFILHALAIAFTLWLGSATRFTP
jgi:hypothetical protein